MVGGTYQILWYEFYISVKVLLPKKKVTLSFPFFYTLATINELFFSLVLLFL